MINIRAACFGSPTPLARVAARVLFGAKWSRLFSFAVFSAIEWLATLVPTDNFLAPMLSQARSHSFWWLEFSGENMGIPRIVDWITSQCPVLDLNGGSQYNYVTIRCCLGVGIVDGVLSVRDVPMSHHRCWLPAIYRFDVRLVLR